MNITVNGQPQQVQEPCMVKAVLESAVNLEISDAGTTKDGSRLGIAVAVNNALVARSAWASRELVDGDVVEIITAVQGG